MIADSDSATQRRLFSGGARLVEMDLNHLNLRVRDAEACRDFYQLHFAFEPAFEADGGYFIRNADGFLLALVPASNHAALPEGFSHRLRSREQ